MRKQIVVGNWKLNGTTVLCHQFASGLADYKGSVELVICPPATHIDCLAGAASAHHSKVSVGGQNVAAQFSGAYTGEVSASMLQELGACYGIVGHSERRALFGETSEMVAQKANRLLEVGMTPIICVGESSLVREGGEHGKFVGRQVTEVLSRLAPSVESAVILAYEPIWAVGTGNTASPEQVQSMHAHIRAVAAPFINAVATRVLYGGSVTPHNAASLLELPDVDGALVGGASLELDKFLAIAGGC